MEDALFDSTMLGTVHPHLRKPFYLFPTVSQVKAGHILSSILSSLVNWMFSKHLIQTE
jgi:hypothetical protein